MQSSFHSQPLKRRTRLRPSQAACRQANHCPSLGFTFLICKTSMIFKAFPTTHLTFHEERRSGFRAQL